MNEPYGNTGLLSQTQVEEYAQGWRRAAFADIRARLVDTDFPCVFARNAFRKQLVKFVFVETAESNGIQHLSTALKAYVELSKRWDGRLDTAYPLVVAFSPDAITARSVEEYHAFGWKVLQSLHEVDPEPWPETVGKDPDTASWSMCFNGMPLFCNMSSPAHHVRRSRNLGQHFVLVINPRERFDVFAGDTPSGRNTRSNIRSRIHHYDGVSHSSQLGSYGAGRLEWLQYGLVEDNIDRTDTCPFVFREPSGMPALGPAASEEVLKDRDVSPIREELIR